MEKAVGAFYAAAQHVGNHPFLEFAGVMASYVNSCRRAHAAGIDFTECSVHSGTPLPIESFEIGYLNEKLNCIFGGRIVAMDDVRHERAEFELA
ncbi:MAG: hypothetical protein ABIW82_17380 [Dokdonella sp.]